MENTTQRAEFNCAALSADAREWAADWSLWPLLRGRTVAITGATGLLGRAAVAMLVALDARHGLALTIVAVARDVQKARRQLGAVAAAAGAGRTQGTATPIIYVRHDFGAGLAVDAPAADLILHFAAPTASAFFVGSPVETIRAVAGGTREALDWAERAGAVLVLASSLEVYGTVDDDSVAVDETRTGAWQPMAVRSCYPLAKQLAECMAASYAKEYGARARVARLAQVFGAGTDESDRRVAVQFARRVARGQDIELHTTGRLSRSYCYTTDAVAAMLCIALRGQDGAAYNVATDAAYISVRDMAALLCREFSPAGRPCQVRVVPREGMGYSPDTRLRLSAERLRALGWAPRHDLREMLRRTVESLRAAE